MASLSDIETPVNFNAKYQIQTQKPQIVTKTDTIQLTQTERKNIGLSKINTVEDKVYASTDDLDETNMVVLKKRFRN
jgi:hypothetical protein